MKELTDKLSAIGAPISEEDQVVSLLGSLPQRYSTLVTALEACVDDVSLSYIQQALIHEEQQKNAGPGKFLVSGGGSERQKSALVGKQEKKLRCYGGDIFVETAPKQESHIEPNQLEKIATQSRSQNNVLEHLLFLQRYTKTSGWMVDSGASSHITCRQDLLTEYKESEKPEKVCLGDGRTVEAIGV